MLALVALGVVAACVLPCATARADEEQAITSTCETALADVAVGTTVVPSEDGVDTGDAIVPDSRESVTADAVEDAGQGIVAQTEDETTVGVASESDADEAQVQVAYSVHRGSKWLAWKGNAQTSGSASTKAYVNGIRVRLLDANGAALRGVEYQACVQNKGWTSWTSDARACGAIKKKLRVEAMRIRLVGEVAERYDVWYRVYAQSYGWLDWAKNGASAGTCNLDKRIGGIQVVLTPRDGEGPGSTARAFVDGSSVLVQGYVRTGGWSKAKTSVGSSKKGRYVSALKATLECDEHSGGVAYKALVHDGDWTKTRKNGTVVGTTKKKRAIEAVTLKLTGEAAQHYDLWYRVYAKGFGWLAWTSDGEVAGSIDLDLSIQRVQTKLVAKGASAPKNKNAASTSCCLGAVSTSMASRSTSGSWKAASSRGVRLGAVKSTEGIEQIRASLLSAGGSTPGGIVYKIHAGGSWSAGTNGRVAGTESSPIDAVRIKLTGDAAKLYSAYYRVYVSDAGWLLWTTNNKRTGTNVAGRKILAIDVRLVRKGTSKPSEDTFVLPTYYYTSTHAACHGQELADATARQRKIVSAALKTPSPGAGLCAAWVQLVYMKAGYPQFWGNANDLYDKYCTSSEYDKLKVGMIIAVSSHNRSYLGGIYGHVCIYLGDNKVMDNIGTVRKTSLLNWVTYYGGVVKPKWGWLGNTNVA